MCEKYNILALINISWEQKTKGLILQPLSLQNNDSNIEWQRLEKNITTTDGVIDHIIFGQNCTVDSHDERHHDTFSLTPYSRY